MMIYRGKAFLHMLDAACDIKMIISSVIISTTKATTIQDSFLPREN
jgi:hypothetical protein